MMACLMDQIWAIGKISKILMKMTPEQVVALAEGGPTNAQGEGVVDRSHPYWKAVADFARLNGGLDEPRHRLHIAYGNVEVKTSAGVLFWDEGKVALQRRKQDQIGLGKPDKWAFVGGGFVPNDTKPDGTKETHAQAAERHAREKSGIILEVPPYGPFHAITKEPYKTSNEGMGIHGTVMRYMADKTTVLSGIEQAIQSGFEVEWFTPEEVRELQARGETTLSEEEIKFLEWKAQQPSVKPEPTR